MLRWLLDMLRGLRKQQPIEPRYEMTIADSLQKVARELRGTQQQLALSRAAQDRQTEALNRLADAFAKSPDDPGDQDTIDALAGEIGQSADSLAATTAANQQNP